METEIGISGTPFDRALAQLRKSPRRWLVTGAAGFIGSHLLEALLRHDQDVVGLDNFATGHQRNLDEVRTLVTSAQWSRLRFLEGDIRDLRACAEACDGVEFVLHQAALGSVPRSLADPLTTNAVNVDGQLNMLVAARDAGVTRFVYAASSSTYGDHPDLPKVEGKIGRPLSPYAVTKLVNELYADVFARSYGLDAIGLRYFNVFGPRQDPQGAYAAVIPKWIAAMLDGTAVQINGDGRTSRDFCFVANAVQANLMAALLPPGAARAEVYNVAVGERTSLLRLHELLAKNIARVRPEVALPAPRFGPFRAGDVEHSQAAIDKARRDLGYEPAQRVEEGLAITVDWHNAARLAAPRRGSGTRR
ncbi:MAG: SDR family oxidoreductase [Dokdonella sp.]